MTAARHILIACEDVAAGESLGLILTNLGCTLTHCTDGSQTLRTITERPPDAILIDGSFADMSGSDLCGKIKLRRETNLVPVIMLTDLHDSSAERSAIRVGANDYVVKPVSPERIDEVIEGAIEHRHELESRNTHTSIIMHMSSDAHPRGQLNDLLSELFLRTPLTDQEIHNIRFAVLEMIENAAEWGNRRRGDQLVTIRYELTDDHVRFVINDEGPGFDRTSLPHAAKIDDPTAHMEIRDKLGLRNGGFGILITKGMVDEFSYNEPGNEVTLIKRFAKR